MTHIEDQNTTVTAPHGTSDTATDTPEIHRIMEVPLEDLQEHPLNAEIYGQEKPTEDFLESISQTGILSPLIANSKNGRIISGHTRFRAAAKLGKKTVPVIYRTYTEEAESLNIVTGNVSRAKSNVQRIREYEALLTAFKQQKKQEASKNDKGVGKVGEKSRQKAADIVGESPATLKKGMGVVKAADKLRKQGDEEGAARLLEILNRRRGFDPAEKEAQRLGLIPSSTKKSNGKKSTDDVSPPEAAESANLDSDVEATPADKVGSNGESGASEVSKLAHHLTEATELLQNAANWSPEDKNAAAQQFATLAAAMALAGIGLTGGAANAK